MSRVLSESEGECEQTVHVMCFRDSENEAWNDVVTCGDSYIPTPSLDYSDSVILWSSFIFIFT